MQGGTGTGTGMTRDPGERTDRKNPAGAGLVLAGTGRAAHALGPALQAAGIPVLAVMGRSQARAEDLAKEIGTSALSPQEDIPRAAKAILVLVSDDAIEQVAASLVSRARAGLSWIHASGSLPAAVLGDARDRAGGGAVLAWHPLAVLDGRPRRLAGVTVTLSGDDVAFSLGERMATALGGLPVPLGSDDRVGYHLAACLAAGHIVGLLGEAMAVARASGLAETVVVGLYGLAAEALTSARERGPTLAATGPIVRGDAGTVGRHLAWLTEHREGIGPGAAWAYVGGGLALWDMTGPGSSGEGRNGTAAREDAVVEALREAASGRLAERENASGTRTEG